jgi:hypothetical protein
MPEPSDALIDTTAASREMLAGTELLKKPKKAERMLANTGVGGYVTNLWDSNSKLDTPKEWVQLREEINKTYVNEPAKRDQALKLLAFRVLIDGKATKALPPTK